MGGVRDGQENWIDGVDMNGCAESVSSESLPTGDV